MSKLPRTKTAKTTTEKTNQLLKDRLPSFAGYYFKSNRDSMAESSLYAYALDITMFFEYIQMSRNINNIKDISIIDFENISEAEIENYMEYSKTTCVNGTERPRSGAALKRRFNILSAFYNFYYSQGMINKLPTLRASRPKITHKAPNIISKDDCQTLIYYILHCDLPSAHEASYQVHFRERDAAIVTLLCYAGLKPSECVKLNISDLHLADHYIIVNGRRYSHITISSYIEHMLSNYLNIRLSIIPRCGDDNALFLSLSGTRILQRSLEKMIKKYTTALFGETRTITANMLSFAFKNQVYNATQSVDITAKLSGSQPTTIEKIYIADIHERQAISLNL